MNLDNLPDDFTVRDLVIAANLLGVDVSAAIAPRAEQPVRVHRASWTGTWVRQPDCASEGAQED